MMIHEITEKVGKHKKRKRVGRGPGSGTGKTSGRGENGQNSRSGGGVGPGFEGGQMPLHRRIPKRGFTNINRVEYQVVNVASLSALEGDVDGVALRAAGLVRSLRKPIKILGDGELTSAVHVTAHAFSSGARSKIEAAGGTATVLGAADQA